MSKLKNIEEGVFSVLDGEASPSWETSIEKPERISGVAMFLPVDIQKFAATRKKAGKTNFAAARIKTEEGSEILTNAKGFVQQLRKLFGNLPEFDLTGVTISTEPVGQGYRLVVGRG